MKSTNITAGQSQKVTTNWLHGVNSQRNPLALGTDQFKWGVNITVRGGIVQTRPGQSMRLSLPAGNLQGGIVFLANKQYSAAKAVVNGNTTIFEPATIFNYDGSASYQVELPYIVFAVDGRVYFLPFNPDGSLTQPTDWNDWLVTSLSLSPDVQEYVFKTATCSAQIGTGGNPQLTPSYNLVVIQDGISSPGTWDGSNNTGNQTTTIPVGYWMAFSGQRLWVATGNIVIASDLANPLGWTEWTQGTGRGTFSFTRPVTGMCDYIGQNSQTMLFVFTDRQTQTLQSGILDRTQWPTTQNFQSTIYPSVGCVAGKSIAKQAGLLWWYAYEGLVATDVAAATYLSSQVLFKDAEMARSKRFMPAEISSICAASYENYLLVSMPYLEALPSSTMVLDYAPANEFNQQRQPAWCGVWTGSRPIEWTSEIVYGQPRLFHFSVDYAATNDGSYNSLWENFMPERVDTYLQINQDGTTIQKNNRIYCQMETALLGDLLDLKQLENGELECCQIGGTVDLSVSYRGSKGGYTNILNRRILAINDSYQFMDSPQASEIDSFGFLRGQYRRIKTQSVSRAVENSSCESGNAMSVDKAFSFLAEWCGEFGIEAIRMFLNAWPERDGGKPEYDETTPCIVKEDGTSVSMALLPSPYDATGDTATSSWVATETQSASLPCSNGSPTAIASATASYTSTISYADAVNQATSKALTAAQQAASNYRAKNPC